ncbi:MAG: hypothetical protein K6T83_00345 [Alicyclobacillus sp.]|nr:hypothetical protein [Alicyclobacillus sp.]
MVQLYIIRYAKGSDWKTSVPMSMKVAKKQAELLSLNGYRVEIIEANESKRIPNTANR